MHVIFTEEELYWIDKRKFGWPIKDKCPSNVKERIMMKKKKIESQKEDKYGKNRHKNR